MWDVMLDVDVDVDAGRRRGETRQDKDTWGQLLIQVLQHEYIHKTVSVYSHCKVSNIRCISKYKWKE
jgi:hypothetical protein